MWIMLSRQVSFAFTTLSLIITIVLLDTGISLPNSLNVGIILPEDQRTGPVDFGYKWALKVLNRDKTLLPNTTLIHKSLFVKPGDSFRASKELCRILSGGVVAIFGGSSIADDSLEWKLYWTSATLDIPVFLPSPSTFSKKGLRNRPATKMIAPTTASISLTSSSSSPAPDFAIRLAPNLSLWGRLLRDLSSRLNLPSVALLYEEDRGLVLSEALLDEPSILDYTIVRRINNRDFKGVFREVKGREIRHLIIDCGLDTLPYLLDDIVSLRMTDYKYHYILTNVDLATVDMTSFAQVNVNLTTFQVVNMEGSYLHEKWVELKNFGDEELNRSVFDRKKPVVHAETGFAFDSVMALALGLSSVDKSHSLRPANLTCDKDNPAPWGDGLSLLNYIDAVEFQGLTGPTAFKGGERSFMKVDIVRLVTANSQSPGMEARYFNLGGWRRVGSWTPDRGLNITKPKSFWSSETPNVTLIVTCVLEKPYVQLKEGNYSGNDRFEGFSIELLKKIAEKVHFKYLLQVVPDGKYGVVDPETGEWNGVVRQLIDKSVDLAIGAITVNHARETVIDFTKPFMNLGISILFRKPDRPPSKLFSFFNPLELDVWLSLLGSYILVSLTMFVVARFSPQEWYSNMTSGFINKYVPQPRSARPPSRDGPFHDDVEELRKENLRRSKVVRNQFSLRNAFWYPIGTLMQQGSDLNPKTTSTRIIGGSWWFFSLVIVSSYTANLAAFLTVERMTTPIESAEDLVEQSDILYGSLESGSTMTFFRDSKIETYQKMWRFMESKKPSVFTKTYADGIDRVLKGNYAFLMESTTIEYVVRNNCNLTQIGGLLDSKDFGIALPIGSPWRDKVSLAILEMQELGVIQQARNKWWASQMSEEDWDNQLYCNLEWKKQDSKASALGVNNIGGIFLILVAGLVFSIFVAIHEFCTSARTAAATSFGQVSICSEMAEEAKFAFRCKGPRRRPALKRQCAKCDMMDMDLSNRRGKSPRPSDHHQRPTTTTTTTTSTSAYHHHDYHSFAPHQSYFHIPVIPNNISSGGGGTTGEGQPLHQPLQ